MKYCVGIVMLSLAFASIKADDQSTLKQLKTAIESSDLVLVKKMWRRLDSSIESLEEKHKLLESLVADAAAISEGTEAPATGGGISYLRISGGVLCSALGGMGAAASGFILGNRYSSAGSKVAAVFLCMGSMGSMYLGRYLVRTGLNNTEAGAVNRSQAQAIEAYLDSRLQEIRSELPAPVDHETNSSKDQKTQQT